MPVAIPRAAAVTAVPDATRARESTTVRAGGDATLCVLLCVYLATLMLEGPLRYGLARAGYPNALYLRDAIPVGTLVFLFMRSLLFEGRVELLIAVPAALLAMHAAIAAVLGVAPFSILFGAKIFMFLPYGMAMWPLIRRRFDSALTIASVAFLVTTAGVFVNFVVGRMPWEGFEYDSAFGTLATTRLWWIPGGVSRLPGLTRTSFDAVMIIGITGMLTMARLRAFLPRAIVVALALPAIVATTSKGMILAFPLAAIWLLADDGPIHAAVGRVMVYLLCGMALAVPLFVVVFDVGSWMHASDFPDRVVSVWERFAMMWPSAFDLLPSGPGALLGAGLGSIGTPQLFGYAPHRANAADSLAIFLIVNFGVLGALYLVAPAFAQLRVAQAQSPTVHRAYTGLLVIAYGYGLSISMIEESFFAVCLGVCLGIMVTSLQEPRRGQRR